MMPPLPPGGNQSPHRGSTAYNELVQTQKFTEEPKELKSILGDCEIPGWTPTALKGSIWRPARC